SEDPRGNLGAAVERGCLAPDRQHRIVENLFDRVGPARDSLQESREAAVVDSIEDLESMLVLVRDSGYEMRLRLVPEHGCGALQVWLRCLHDAVATLTPLNPKSGLEVQ